MLRKLSLFLAVIMLVSLLPARSIGKSVDSLAKPLQTLNKISENDYLSNETASKVKKAEKATDALTIDTDTTGAFNQELTDALSIGDNQLSFYDYEGSFSWTVNEADGRTYAVSTNQAVHSSDSICFTSFTAEQSSVILSFDYAVSSESGYDKFIVYFDGEQIFSDSGSVSWKNQRIELAIETAGEHSIYFGYSKDSSASSYNDCAYIDNVGIYTSEDLYAVTFIDGVTGEVISTQYVFPGANVEEFPSAPNHEGYIFAGWSSTGESIMADTTITAQYTSIADGFAGGDGTFSQPYLISTVEELLFFREAVNSGGNNFSGIYFSLANDLDLGGISWEPIGYEASEDSISRAFCGNFDGNNHVITNFNITSINITSYRRGDTSKSAGLFGYLAGNAHVYNLGVTNFEINLLVDTVRVMGGGITGSMNNAMISNCYSTGNIYVNTSNKGWASSGGIVGDINRNSTVTNCYATGDVSGIVSTTISGNYNAFVGGVIGFCDDNNGIFFCYATGDVYAESKENNSWAGGVVGDSSNVDNISSVANCYATGDVYAIADASSSANFGVHSGGVTGEIKYGDLSCCYATGNVTAEASGTSVSQLYLGAVIGNNKNNAEITYCYYLDTCIEENNEYGTVLTDEQMRTTTAFRGFDFNNIWIINQETSYPYPTFREMTESQSENFIIPDDAFSFSHGSVANYSTSLRNFLLAGLEPNEREAVRRLLDQTKWGGSCQGMSAVAFLFKAGRLNPEYWQEDATMLNDIELDNDFRSLINYYFAAQNIDEYQNAMSSFIRNTTNKQALQELLNSINAIDDNNRQPVFFTFSWSTQVSGQPRQGHGHAILAYDIEYNLPEEEQITIDGITYTNRILTYDINSGIGIDYPNAPDLTDSKNLYFTTNLEDWTIPSYFNRSNVTVSNTKITFVTRDVNLIEYNNPETLSRATESTKVITDGSYANLIVPQNSGITVVDASGKSFSSVGLKGDLDVIEYFKPDSSDAHYLLPSNESAYNILSELGEMEYTINYCDNMFVTVSAGNANQMRVDPNGSIAIDGEASSVDMSMTFNSSANDSLWDKMSISSEATDSLEMSINNNKDLLIKGDSLTDTSIEFSNSDGSGELTLDTEFDTVKIVTTRTTNATVEVAAIVDEDGDGEFESVIGETEVTIKEEHVGDVDYSGNITTVDALLILRKLAGWEIEVDLEVADIDGNNSIDASDALWILRYLADWDVPYIDWE